MKGVTVNIGQPISHRLDHNLVAGYQSLNDVGSTGGGQFPRASVDCNLTLLCQPDKLVNAMAVARFYTNGHQDTGTLINNEAYDGRVYFVTGFHILDANKNGALDPSEINAFAFLFLLSCFGGLYAMGQFTIRP